MSDDLDLRASSLPPPGSTDPVFTLVDDLTAANLQVSAPILALPRYRQAEMAPVGLLASRPWFTTPEFVQVPARVALLRQNRFFGSRLLYRGATGFEKALADVDGERITQINAELIRAIWDAWACPAPLLAYLAWAVGVEYWNDNWSETTKRAWIDIQLWFKSMRGTRKALEIAVNYAGRDISPFGYSVTDVKAAPQKIFSGPSLTRAQREDWLSRLPQVRVWNTNDEGHATLYKSFYGSSASNRLHSRRFQLDGPGHGKLTAAVPSDALTRLKRTAKWIEKGVETDIRVTNYGSYFQLHKSGKEDSAIYSNRPFSPDRYYIPSTAHNRLLTIQPTPALPWRSQMTPSLEAVTSEPERVKVAGLRKHSVFSNTPMHDFFAPTTAPRRIYQRYAVLDPTVRELRRTPVQFMGVGRYGFPNFTAWASVSISGKLSSRAAGFEYWAPKSKFYLPHNGEPLRQVKLAVQGSKALRDKIMLQIGPQPRFLAGERPVLAGIDTVLAGSI